MASKTLKVIPLGGLGEIGRNMLVLEYDDQLLIVDAGLMFPNNDMYGVDVVIPDMSYVFERADQVLGILITHAHEDHIGALHHLLAQVRAPVYATALTRGFIEVRLREAHLLDADLHTIKPRDTWVLGAFRIECFHMSHSIPDSLGLAIETPLGLVVHSGDFKFDHNPVDGQRSDFAKLAELGERGVLLLLSDSTNAETRGYTPSEKAMEENLRTVFNKASGRVLVAMFASNISRVQQVADISREFGRRVAVVGKSMIGNIRIARELGYLNLDPDALLTLNQIDAVPAREVTIICTGSQGEPASALVRMGNGDYRTVKVAAGDTVIVSATPIPGNEELVNRTLDNLFRLGAHVYYDDVFDVHVSGHASQEEQKLLLNLLRPTYFVPIHGEYRHLVWHGRLAADCGVATEHVFIMESGDVLEISSQGAQVVDHLGGEYVYVSGNGAGSANRQVIDDRRLLANEGFILAVVNIDKYTGGVVGLPQVVSRGVLNEVEADALYGTIRDKLSAAAETGGTRSELSKRLEAVLTRAVQDAVARKPMVMAVVNKV
ncbi:MAG: ribonuclease J [Chloroflexi bacterium]|nr:ribonuclease J [Chloroflexota bacterium]